MTDIEIAQSATLLPITKIAESLKINPDVIEQYGKFKAKLPLNLIDQKQLKKNKLILVTAISPTPAGEGKTTISIGLALGLNKIGKQAIAVLREPSLGPVFGMKGGAAGGGYSQVLPMEDINLHFTGDFAAIEKAHNLLSALIDNNIQSKSRNLGLDPRTIAWKRVMDMNDRSLRQIIIGLGGTGNGIPREASFDITAASEVMAIICLAESMSDLKRRLGNIFIGFTMDKKPVHARDLNAAGAMAILLRDAIKPNLVQTTEGTPAILHGGPFANLAQGTNSVIATKMGLSLAPFVVTEAGFGADLGAEKFLNIKCQSAEIAPSAVVLVATVKALKYHGGAPLATLKEENKRSLENGFSNLEKHISNIQKFGLPVVVAINRFPTDTSDELSAIAIHCAKINVESAICNVWAEGGQGAIELAQKVGELVANSQPDFKPLYKWNEPVRDKIRKIATEIYGADDIEFSSEALKNLRTITELGLDELPICMAKTQYSFSDDPKLLGRPFDFTIHIRAIEIAAGAGFLIPLTGEMMRMPGLPATPAAEGMDIDENGRITGLA